MSQETRHDRRLARGIARHGRLRRPSGGRTAVKALAAVTAVVIASTGSVAAFAAWDLARTVQANAVDIGDGKAAPPSIGGSTGAPTSCWSAATPARVRAMATARARTSRPATSTTSRC
ncbi:hypothetical protein BC477_10845 [Clavibacter michiganensis subsp. michiganensis]|nr:hypothetical protein BC477_10845 [Clavibacter michiganensis subsp. michiganensis]